MTENATTSKQDVSVVCEECKCNVSESSLLTLKNEEKLCPQCCAMCSSCEGYFEHGELTYMESDSGSVCEKCRDRYYRTCGRCDFQFHINNSQWMYGEEGMCDTCSREDDEDDFPDRDWEDDSRVIGTKHGVILKTLRKFGIELEASYPSIKAIYNAKEHFKKSIGITPDSGAEFQTPPACGDVAEDMIHDLCRALTTEKFTTPNGCGLHVHIDAKDIESMSKTDRTQRIKALWLFYIVFDDIIRKFINPFRRRNSMCRETHDMFVDVSSCKEEFELERLWYNTNDDDEIRYKKNETKDSSRYRGFNLHSLLNDWHLEIRYHESTLDPRAILEWSNLHARIMDKVKEGISIGWLSYMYTRTRHKKDAFYDFLELTQSSRTYWNKKIKQCAE